MAGKCDTCDVEVIGVLEGNDVTIMFVPGCDVAIMFAPACDVIITFVLACDINIAFVLACEDIVMAIGRETIGIGVSEGDICKIILSVKR